MSDHDRDRVAFDGSVRPVPFWALLSAAGRYALMPVIVAACAFLALLSAAEAPCVVVSTIGACIASGGGFVNNGLGQRVRMVEKTNGSITSNITYLWAGGAIAEERDSTGATVAKRYLGGGMMVGATKYFFTTDHLGSVREVTDNSGNVVSRFDYDSYGNRTQVSGTFDPGRGFTGHWHHASGLILTWFRAYDPQTARWLSRDPIGENDGTNLYAYVGGNPINNLDPLGLWSWGCFFKGAAKAVAGAVVGVAVAAVVVATMPAAVVVGLGVAASAAGGWAIGQATYEASSGHAWAWGGDGAQLSDGARSQRGGQAFVGAATLGLSGLRWSRRDAKGDWAWLRLGARGRMADEMGKITVSPKTWGDVGGLPPGERGLGLGDLAPSQLPKTWGTGASPGLRQALPYATAGAGGAGGACGECD